MTSPEPVPAPEPDHKARLEELAEHVRSYVTAREHDTTELLAHVASLGL